MVEVQVENKTLQVGGRVARLIGFLAEQAERINGPEKLQVTFNCAGNSFNVELKERLAVNRWGDPVGG